MSATSVVARLEQLADIGKHERGIDRALATPAERRARELFASWARDGGYAPAQDAVGNLFARRPGARPHADAILVGSHLDTVPTGGAYDGAYGVAGAICALQLLDARAVTLQHPVEAVAWAGEEGSRFPLGCLGSSVFAGLWRMEDVLALPDADDVTLREALNNTAGGLLQGVPQRTKQRTAAFLELHVEQGPVLEREGVHLGIVTAIAGQRRYRVAIEGDSGHAGTVPMNLRTDPLGAAAQVILAIEFAARQAGKAVATVGRFIVEPGGTNVIPACVTFSLDVRSPHEECVEALEKTARATLQSVRVERGVRVTLERLEARAPMPMDERMRAAVHRAIAAMNEPAIDILSGAGHDAMCLAQIAPAAMIFVPSIGGRSHVGDECTSEADLELGVEALAAAIVEVDDALNQN